jgi:hypothetical protein
MSWLWQRQPHPAPGNDRVPQAISVLAARESRKPCLLIASVFIVRQNPFATQSKP